MARKASKHRLRDFDNRRAKITRQDPQLPTLKPPAGSTTTVAAICGLLLLAVALIFVQSAGHGFVNFDDPQYVQENPVVACGVTAEGIAWSFGFHNGNWHPLTWISHMLDCQFFGADRPAGHHSTAVLLHAVNTLLVFLVLRNMTGDLWPAAVAAALFGVHPLHVESVAWIAERKDVLSGLFFMLSLAAYAGYARRPFSIFRYLLVTITFALGLMAKPMLVTLPLVFLLLDYWPLRRWVIGGQNNFPFVLLLEKLPWLALSAGSCMITYFAQEATESVWTHLPFATRAANALVSYIVYLGQFIYPVRLAAFYPHPQEVASAWQIVYGVFLLVGITIVSLVCRKKCPYLSVGWFWFLGMLVPVIGLVQVGAQAMADRYSYLPQIGLYIASAWGLSRLAKSWLHRRAFFAALTALVLAASMIAAWSQAAYWKNGVTLWSRVVASTAPNSWPHNNLGAAFAARGNFNAAAGQFRAAVAVDPDDEMAHFNLALALVRTDQIGAAIEQFQQVLRIKPNDAMAHGDLGALLLQQGHLDAAIAHLERAQQLDPNDAKALAYLPAARSARQNSANPQIPPPRRGPR
jgi:tetratricopeptide (TPR) repeat protein